MAKSKVRFPFEKEHKKDQRICRRCGKIIKDYMGNGICDNCTKDLVQENFQNMQRSYWKVDEKQAKELNVK